MVVSTLISHAVEKGEDRPGIRTASDMPDAKITSMRRDRGVDKKAILALQGSLGRDEPSQLQVG